MVVSSTAAAWDHLEPSLALYRNKKSLFQQVIYLCYKQTVKATGLCFVVEGNG